MIYGKFEVESNGGSIMTYADNIHRINIEEGTFEYFLNGSLTKIEDIDSVIEVKFIDGEDVEESIYEECDGCGECESMAEFVTRLTLEAIAETNEDPTGLCDDLTEEVKGIMEQADKFKLESDKVEYLKKLTGLSDEVFDRAYSNYNHNKKLQEVRYGITDRD